MNVFNVLRDKLEEKIKVTSMEIIVTGTKEKPYFEIKYKEVGKEYYNIGYSSYDLNNVFVWKEECFEIVNQIEQEYKNGWIPCSERLPQENEPVDAVCEVVNIMLKSGTVTSGWCNRYLERWYVLDEHCDYPLHQNYEDVIAWRPLPQPFNKNDPPKKPSNFERIRSMDVEELVELLPCPYDIAGDNIMPCLLDEEAHGMPTTEQCKNCMLEWLRKEVE